MKGLELSEKYFESFGRPMLEENFQDLLPFIAVGLTGSGSECFGFDDEISRDHDFEPGFCIFIPGEDIIDRKQAFALERAYAKLPKEFEDVKRSQIAPVGGSRHGVIRTDEFFREKTGLEMEGTGSLIITERDWMTIPDYALAEAVNGRIFLDNYGEVTNIRNQLSNMPEDIRRKKLAGSILLMAQAGQYNFPRILMHGEPAAAQMAVFEFVKSAMQTVFLLNRRYMPFYKWSFRAFSQLPMLSELADTFHYLLTTDNEGLIGEDKTGIIEGVADRIIEVLKEQELTQATCHDLEKHAYSVNDSIMDVNIRNMHILSAV